MFDTPPPQRRRFCFSPGHLPLVLLAAEGFLLLSERFCWFAFNEHKGWTVLIAIAVVAATTLVMFLWFLVALVFRRRFQFGIRTLLVLMVAVAVPCSWLAVQMKAAREQAARIAAIGQLRGYTMYDFETEGFDGPLQDIPLAISERLRTLLGDDFFAEVDAVYLSDTTTTDADLRLISGWRKLQELELSRSRVTDVGVKCLDDLPELTELDVSQTCVTDDCLQVLDKLPKLDDLSLGSTKITDRGLRCIQRQTWLKSLDVGDTQITDEGIATLIKGLTHLTSLGLEGARRTDAALVNLESLTQLEVLDLSDTQVTDKGLEFLKSLDHLETLWLCDTKATDEGVEKLRKALPKCNIRTSLIIE